MLYDCVTVIEDIVTGIITVTWGTDLGYTIEEILSTVASLLT